MKRIEDSMYDEELLARVHESVATELKGYIATPKGMAEFMYIITCALLTGLLEVENDEELAAITHSIMLSVALGLQNTDKKELH